MQVNAEETDEKGKSKVVLPSDPKPLDEGTLDWLKPKNQDLPYSSYELTEVNSNSKDNPNVITEYLNNGQTSFDEKYNAKYYEIKLKKTEYGSAQEEKNSLLKSEPDKEEGTETKYFKWEKDDKGNYLFKESTNGGTQITTHYDKSSNQRYNSTNTVKRSVSTIEVKGENITHDFINLKDDNCQDNDSDGGAILNSWNTIGDVVGNFIGNGRISNTQPKKEAQKEEDKHQVYVYGGGILNANYAHIGKVTGDFIGNYVKSQWDAAGGAIYSGNKSNMNDIVGNFVGNYSISQQYQSEGGAIANFFASMSNITGDFLFNYTYSESGLADGGAIMNYGNDASIGTITGDFIGNHVHSLNGYADGGAIKNDGANTQESLTNSIGDIVGNFIANYAHGTQGSDGGAISNNNQAKIGNLTGDFIGNYSYADNSSGNAYGGAIYNYYGSSIGNIKGDFLGNRTYSEQNVAHGGAIDNCNSTIGNITGNFWDNFSVGVSDVFGGAIYNYRNQSVAKNEQNNNGEIKSVIGNITGDFIDNHVYATNTTKANSSSSAKAFGGAIYNNDGNIGNIDGNFYYNSAISTSGEARGGAIANDGKLGNLHGNFYSNSASKFGGAIYNAGSIGENSNNQEAQAIDSTSKDNNKGIFNSSFYYNYAGEHGGAIYTSSSLKLTAENSFISEFAGNKAANILEAIYVDNSQNKQKNSEISNENNNITLTLNAVSNGKFNFFDSINGSDNYNLHITGDSSGVVNLLNNVSNANIQHENVTTNVFDTKFLNNNNSLDMKSGTLNLHNFGFSQLNFDNFSISGGTINIDSADVNLAYKQMGKIIDLNKDEDKTEVKAFSLSDSESKGGTINVFDLNVFADSSSLTTTVNFADLTFAGNVKSDVCEAYGPIFHYSVEYLSGTSTNTISSEDSSHGGDFLFTRIGFNPAILASAVAQLTGGYASMVQTYNYAFEHADTFSALPSSVRNAMLNQNKYAITEGNLSLYNNHLNKNALWFRPYNSFESIPLKNGPKTSTILYGSFIGADSELFDLNNGWKSAITGYIGYNGSSQNYKGNHTYQNGIVGGITDTFYKNNFYTAITASVGSSIGESDTMFGNEDFTMLMGGVASKTGYNFEFNNGRFVIQPNLLLSYTFINTFDYTNAANVRINAEPLHAIQVHPYIKFIQNTESGWQPYLAGGFVYNVMGQTQIRVADLYGNNVQLPALSIKPYAEYGLGVQKLWDDKYTGFLQAMARSGGRNGIALSFGFRMLFGDLVDNTKDNFINVSDKHSNCSNCSNSDSKSQKLNSDQQFVTSHSESQKPSSDQQSVTSNSESQKSSSDQQVKGINKYLLKFSNFFCLPSNPHNN